MASDSTAFSGTIPHYYETGMGPIVFADAAVDMARRVAASSPQRVLETAAGTGIVTRELRNVLPRGTHLTSTDLQASMLEVARTKFQPGEQVDFLAADATALPFADGSFDAVVCQFGVMFFPDKERSFREVHRVLTNGGCYHFSIWDTHAHNAYGRITHETCAAMFPDDPPQFMSIPFSARFDDIKDALVAAEFSEITATVRRFRKDIPDTRRFAEGLVYGSPIIDRLRARGTVDPNEMVSSLTDRLHEELGNPATTTLQAIAFTAVK